MITGQHTHFLLQKMIIDIPDQAKDKLLRYNYPGNIRRLKAMINLAAVTCNGKKITAAGISFQSGKGDNVFLTEEKSLKQCSYNIIKLYLKKYSIDIAGVADKLIIGKSAVCKMIQRKAITL